MSSMKVVFQAKLAYTNFVDPLVYYRRIANIINYYHRTTQISLPRSLWIVWLTIFVVCLRDTFVIIAFFFSSDVQIAMFNLITITGGDPNHQFVLVSLDTVAIVLYLRLYPLLYHDRSYRVLLVVKQVIEKAIMCADCNCRSLNFRIEQMLKFFKFSKIFIIWIMSMSINFLVMIILSKLIHSNILSSDALHFMDISL